MTIKDTIKQQIKQVLVDQYKRADLAFNINYPPSPDLGDYSANVAMILAKELHRNPVELAEELAAVLRQGKENKMWEKIEAIKPGFLNFYLKADWLDQGVTKILKQGKKYGQSNEGKGQTVVVDYSAPNIAKKMHVGHLRSTVIGAAICNLYKFLDYKVIGDNHLGDWGTQFGKMISQYKKIYGEKIKKDISIDEMEKLYLDFHREAKDNPAREDEARQELKKLQAKEKFNYQLWQLFYKVSIAEFKKVYELLGVKFEAWHGESFYHKMLPGIVVDALDKKVAIKSEGAIIINLEKFNLPPLMIQKSDSAYLYGTSDLATIKYRRAHYHFTKNIYVVANQQALHFEQLFKASELLGYHDQEEMVHVKFGLILGKGGKKMSTREGEVADLTKIIDEGIAKARARILEKNKELKTQELADIATAVALGAIKYNDLSQNRLTDIVFDWDKMLNFESGSAPYLQYTYVRVQSILQKIKKSKEREIKKLRNKEIKGTITQENRDKAAGETAENKLKKDLLKFPEAIEAAAAEYKPNILALYLETLAADFHSFYEQVSIINSEPTAKQARLKLIRAVATVMKTGLGLLGIEAPSKM